MMAYQSGAQARVSLLSAAALLAVATTPAHAADQFKQAADGAFSPAILASVKPTLFAICTCYPR